MVPRYQIGNLPCSMSDPRFQRRLKDIARNWTVLVISVSVHGLRQFLHTVSKLYQQTSLKSAPRRRNSSLACWCSLLNLSVYHSCVVVIHNHYSRCSYTQKKGSPVTTIYLATRTLVSDVRCIREQTRCKLLPKPHHACPLGFCCAHR